MADLRLPFWKHYPRDWLADQRISLLTLEQEGALRRLMDHYWIEGAIPDDPAKLARLLRMDPERFEDAVWPEIRQFFVSDGDGQLEHEELAHERHALLEQKRTFREAGRRGAMKRWHGQDGDGGDPPEDSPPNGEANGDPNRGGIGEASGDPMPYALAREGRRQTAEGRGGSSEEDGAPTTDGAKSPPAGARDAGGSD